MRGGSRQSAVGKSTTHGLLPNADCLMIGMADPRAILSTVFGFSSFRPGQEEIVSTLLAGKNVLAVMPTGSGKSLCYQVPALAFGGLTVIVSPLVALMRDQVAALQLQGVAAETINSSQDREQNVAIWRRVAAGDVRLLYLSPERLMTERMLAALRRLPISLLAVDEAHCISQWGPSFRPEYEMLSSLREAFPDVPIGGFTATADEITRADIQSKLFAGTARMYVHGFDRPNIRLMVEPKRELRKQLLMFLAEHQRESGIIYCLSRKRTDEIAAELTGKGIRALPYHAGMEKAARDENQNLFMTEPGIVMVATIAFGMGIDKPDVRFVVHVDLPGSPEAYYQEIGRAGRDGKSAVAQMFFGYGDLRTRRMFIDEENEGNDERRRRERKRLDALVGYCEAPNCRRMALLGYFGETAAPCGNCDICLDPTATLDGTAEGKLILSVIVATGERYGASHIIDVLKGVATEKAVAAGHDRLSVFGKGEARTRQVWQSLIRQLVAATFLKEDSLYGGLSIAPRGRELMGDRERFGYRPVPTRKTRKERLKVALEAAGVDADEDLLARLKRKRMELARERQVPAYVIFSDRSLIDMATKRPRTIDEFATVHGVGRAKLAEFADAFLEVLETRPMTDRS
jgi:ATP-dependent DNA helicase RecQ